MRVRSTLIELESKTAQQDSRCLPWVPTVIVLLVLSQFSNIKAKMRSGLATDEEVAHLSWWSAVLKRPPIPKNDRRRCEVVDEYHALLPHECDMFDQLCNLVTKLFGVKYAAVSMVSRDVAFIPGQSGGYPRVFPRNMVLCNYVIKKGGALCIPDATQDLAFADEPDVSAYGIRFFAAVPLTTSDGYHLGTVCIADEVCVFYII